VLLLTVPGVASVDRGEWGDRWQWSLTRHSATRLFEQEFGSANVAVTAEGNVTEEARALVEVIGPALEVSRTGPKQLFPGKPGHYENVVTNPGPSPATNVPLNRLP